MTELYTGDLNKLNSIYNIMSILSWAKVVLAIIICLIYYKKSKEIFMLCIGINLFIILVAWWLEHSILSVSSIRSVDGVYVDWREIKRRMKYRIFPVLIQTVWLIRLIVKPIFIKKNDA